MYNTNNGHTAYYMFPTKDELKGGEAIQLPIKYKNLKTGSITDGGWNYVFRCENGVLFDTTWEGIFDKYEVPYCGTGGAERYPLSSGKCGNF